MSSTQSPPLWLITGATGFVGRELLRQIAQQQCPVETKLLLSKDSSAQSRKNHLCGDLRDPDSLSAVCKNVTTVIHLAGIAHVGAAASKQARAVNLEGALALLHAAISAGVRRFVYLSTVLAAEPASTRTAYGEDKAAVERALLAAAKAKQIEVVILRATNIYGPEMRGNLAALIRLTHAKLLPRLPRLDSYVSLVGVSDVAGALIAAASEQRAPRDSGGVLVTLTDGQRYSMNALQDSVYAALGRHPSHLRMPAVILFTAAATAEILGKLGLYRGGIGLHTARNLTRDAVFDNAEAQQRLSWQPSTTFYTELPALIEAVVKKR
mgnify:CR=1 FL=1